MLLNRIKLFHRVQVRAPVVHKTTKCHLAEVATPDRRCPAKNSSFCVHSDDSEIPTIPLFRRLTRAKKFEKQRHLLPNPAPLLQRHQSTSSPSSANRQITPNSQTPTIWNPPLATSSRDLHRLSNSSHPTGNSELADSTGIQQHNN